MPALPDASAAGSEPAVEPQYGQESERGLSPLAASDRDNTEDPVGPAEAVEAASDLSEFSAWEEADPVPGSSESVKIVSVGTKLACATLLVAAAASAAGRHAVAAS